MTYDKVKFETEVIESTSQHWRR